VISVEGLRTIAEARLEDARVLLENDRLDSAVYLGGYAVELALKARICVTLNWKEFPETRGEFGDYASFKTHKLHALLRLSGQEERIKAEHALEWSVASWDPEVRYRAVGRADRETARAMVASVKHLLGAL
jgi:HEPN domain-containing protein